MDVVCLNTLRNSSTNPTHRIGVFPIRTGGTKLIFINIDVANPMNRFQISITNPAGDCEEFTVEEGSHSIGSNQDADLQLPESFAWRNPVNIDVEAYGATLFSSSPAQGYDGDQDDEMTGTYHPYPVTLLVDLFELRIDLIDPLRGLEDRLDAADPASTKSYDIGDLIGKGGMSTVYRAGDSTLGRNVAMKVMQAKGSDIRIARRRFLREAMVLGRLEHPNIVPIHDFGRDLQGRLFYTMKLVRGRTLRSVLHGIREGDQATITEFPLERMLSAFKKVCDAVAFAHSRGIIHRDLKPENVMIGEFGEVLVMDWGLAKILRNEESEVEPANQDIEGFNEFTTEELADLSATLTVAGVVVGTPQYMSPEQAEGKVREVREESDIFSLGGILYSILTLRPPVAGKSVGDVLQHLKSGHVTNPTHFNHARYGSGTSIANLQGRDSKDSTGEHFELNHLPQQRVPNALAAVAMRALSRDPSARHESADRLKQDIEAFQGGYATSAEELTGWGHLVLLIRRNQILAGAALVVVLLSLTFVFQLLRSRDEAVMESQNARAAEDLARHRETKALNALLEAQLAHAQAALQNADGALLSQELSLVPESIRNHHWDYLWSRRDDSRTSIVIPQVGGPPRIAPANPGALILLAKESKLFALESDGATNRVFDPALPAPLMFRCSADGARIAVGSGNSGLCRILDWESGEILQTIEFAPEAVDSGLTSVQLSPNGKLLALRFDASAKLAVFNVLNGWQLWSRSGVGPVTFHPHQPYLALQDGDTLRLLSAESGIERDHITPSTADFHVNTRIRFSPDGQRLAASDNQGFLRIYRTRNRTRTAKFRVRDRIAGFEFTRDNRIVTLGQDIRGQTTNAFLELREKESGHVLHSFLGVPDDSRSFSFHTDSGNLVTSGNAIKRWFVPVGQEERILNTGTRNPATLEFSEEEQILTPYQGRQLFLVDLKYNDAWRPLAMPIPPDRGLALGDKLLFAASMHEAVLGTFHSYSADRPHEHLHERTHSHKLAALGATTDGRLIAASYLNGSIELLDGEDLAVVKELILPEGVAKQLSFTADDELLVCLSEHPDNDANSIGLFSLPAPQRFDSLEVPFSASLTCLSTLTRSGLLVAGDTGGSFNIVNARSRQLVQRYRAHDHAVTTVAVHSGAGHIATGSEDLTVKIWDRSNGSMLWQAVGLTHVPTRLAFNPSGGMLAVAQKDGSVRIWKLPFTAEPPAADVSPSIQSASARNSEFPSTADSPDPTP